MMPVIHCSTGTICLIPRITFGPRKDVHLAKCYVSEKYIKQNSSQRFQLPKSSLRLFQFNGSNCSSGVQVRSAIGTDVSVEEPNPSVSEQVAEEGSEAESSSTAESRKPPTPNPGAYSNKSKQRSRPVRRSEMPPVKDEELVPGASFTGKVRSIQPFGCFVDFGAFTDGLVHVSRLSDGYVKDVASFVTIGQEIKVRVVEANKETGRISLTMRENDDASKVQQKKENVTSESGENPRPARRNSTRTNPKREDVQKSTKLVKGQILDGTVKNVTRSGAFVSFPDGEEGFLPVAEESEGFGGILGNSSLEVGQEVNVRVLRISRGKVTLTMKKEEDIEALNMQLSKGVVHKATNPFELAFRKNKEIASFLNEREETQKSSKKLEQPVRLADETTVSNFPEVSSQEDTALDEVAVVDDAKDTISTVGSVDGEKLSSEGTELIAEATAVLDDVKDNISIIDSVDDEQLSSKGSEILTDTPGVVANEAPGSDNFRELDNSSSGAPADEASATDDIKDTVAANNTAEEEMSTDTPGVVANEAPGSDNFRELDNSSSGAPADEASATDDIKDTVAANDTAEEEMSSSEAAESLEKSSTIANIEEVPTPDNMDCFVSGVDKFPENVSTASIEVRDASANEDKVTVGKGNEEESTGGLIPEPEASVVDEGKESESIKGPTSGTNSPSDKVLSPEDYVPIQTANEETHEESPIAVTNEASSVKPAEPNGQGKLTTATISPSLVKQLREETGAGMMDCKKALAETGGDIVKAQEFLRKKGLAGADKKASRATTEGRIGSYIHDNRIGVLVEVNCETDFVSRGDIFKELVDDLAMQVAACPQVRYLVTEDVPEDLVNKEKEIEMQKEDILNKPENIRPKIVEGRIRKRLEELALLEQPYIKNDKLSVKDWVKQTISTVGENIKVKRFVRYNLGEGLEKKNQDFAAEVAAQTAAKPPPAVPKDQSADTKETSEKAQKVVVSAALVKQLRDETGAGMMDCKKALAESGGDLEMAQEYLRKKGLSSADKKSSRLAAEGIISAYVHDTRIGALIEVNCETDFVARNEKFRELVNDLAMQVVACPQVESVSIEEVPESIINKEREIEMQRDDLESKPDHIKEKIVEGRITKRLGELALLEQPFIKDDSIKVKDLVKQTIATLGENIKVRRFVRFTLGETKD